MRKVGRRSEEDPSDLDCANPGHTTCQKPVRRRCSLIAGGLLGRWLHGGRPGDVAVSGQRGWKPRPLLSYGKDDEKFPRFGQAGGETASMHLVSGGVVAAGRPRVHWLGRRRGRMTRQSTSTPRTTMTR